MRMTHEPEGRAIIFNNTFSRCSGYVKSSVLYLKQYFKIDADVATNFCSSFHVLNNTFSHNLLLTYDNGLITLGCEDEADIQ